MPDSVSVTAYQIRPETDTAYRLASLYNLLQNFGTSDDWIARAKPNEPRERLYLYDLIEFERHALRGELDKAETVARRLATPSDDSMTSVIAATMASYFLKDYEKAVEYWATLQGKGFESMVVDKGDGTDIMVAAAHSYRAIGNTVAGDRLLTRARTLVEAQLDAGRKDAELWYRLAEIDAIEGHRQMALINLQRAANEGWRDYWLPAIDPAFESIREARELKTMMAGIETQMELMREQFAFERAFATVSSDGEKGS